MLATDLYLNFIPPFVNKFNWLKNYSDKLKIGVEIQSQRPIENPKNNYELSMLGES